MPSGYKVSTREDKVRWLQGLPRTRRAALRAAAKRGLDGGEAERLLRNLVRAMQGDGLFAPSTVCIDARPAELIKEAFGPG